jgi:hypothetical protein
MPTHAASEIVVTGATDAGRAAAGMVPLSGGLAPIIDAMKQSRKTFQRVAGHPTMFVTRAREPFWSIRPAWFLVAAVGGTQVLATQIAVAGTGGPGGFHGRAITAQ